MSSTLNRTDHSDAGKSVLALVFSLTPLWFLVREKSRLGLDNLHLGLVQVLLLILLRAALNFNPVTRWKQPQSGPVVALSTSGQVDAAKRPRPESTPSSEQGLVPKSNKPAKRAPKSSSSSSSAAANGSSKSRVAPPPPSDPSLYPVEVLDQTLRAFVDITVPEFSSRLSSPPPANARKTPDAVALDDWKSLFSADNVEVLEHPSTKALYAIRAVFADLPLRKLYELLVSVDQRKSWDSMCQDTAQVEEFELKGRTGAVAWLGMKGMAIVKPKDMVLLSMVVQVPPPKDQPSHKRIICASTSFDHPDCPPKPAFNRMNLGVAGFMIEAEGENGSRITQISDLSGLGSWVPSAVFRTVTQTMIPKSLKKLADAAAQFDLSKSRFPDDDWLPPMLGEFDESKSGRAVADDDDEAGHADEEGDSDDESEKRVRQPVAPQSRDVNALVGQLRQLTTRLNALEEKQTVGWQDMSLATKVGLLGGAAAAATGVALLGAWQRRRR